MQKEKLSHLLEKFPLDYSEYFIYEELIERMSERTKLRCRNIGKSSKQTDIFAYEIGSGSIKAFIYGLPHSDEPIGTLTVDMITRLVEENKELLQDFSFFLIPCIDPEYPGGSG